MTRTKIVLLLVLFAISFPSSVFAVSIEDATVNLYCRVKTAGRTYSTTGSGVFIHESGIILTNAHVAQYFLFGTSSGSTKAECSVRQGNVAKAKYEAELVYLSPSWARDTVDATVKLQPRKGTGESDFALLRISKAKRGKISERFTSIPISVFIKPLTEGDEITIAGYPAEGLSFKEIQQKLKYKTAEAEITAIQSFLRPLSDLLTLPPTELSASGSSGGPIIRSDELVGIAVTVSGTASKEDRGLRAITLSYIDRAIRTETGSSLLSLISVANLTTVNPALPPYADLKKTIEKTLRNSRE